MASMVAMGSSSSNQVSSLMSVQEKGSRNKRKFRADPPLGDPSSIPSPQSECPSYEFCAAKYELIHGHGQANSCDFCGVNQGCSDGLKLDLGLSSAVSDVGTSRPREETEADEFEDADWNDLSEAQLEELVLSNLDTIFKSAIKKIVACGFTKEVATKAILRSGLCYGCKDTVSNIVENTLAFLRSGQDISSSREQCFEDLQQLEKYILAELVCVLREVRPFFSTGDAMWCLLICDMNVSLACAMDGDPLSGFIGDGVSNGSSSPIDKTEGKTSEMNLPSPCKPIPQIPCSHSSQLATSTVGATIKAKPKKSLVHSGKVSEQEGTNFVPHALDKTFSAEGTSQPPSSEEKFVCGRKFHSTKREYILRHKSLHLEKNYRTYGSKGSSRVKLSGLGGLISDKKVKPVSEAIAVNIKNASLKIGKEMGADALQDNQDQNHMVNPEPPSAASFSLDNASTMSALPKTDASSPLAPVANPLTSPAFNNLLATANTELSLSLPTKSNPISFPVDSYSETLANSSFAGMPYDRSLGIWVPQDKKEATVMMLVSRVRELQNQLQEWTEWANQKVMQAARRLSKDKGELKTLRQEKEEVERLKKEKQSLEENTMKKLSEMENALFKASGQVERANAAVRRLEVENAVLRQEMEVAKLRAAESAASVQEVSKREKKTLMKCQSWEKSKTILQEELVAEKRKVTQMLQDLEQAKVLQEKLEAKWQEEQNAKEELLSQAGSIRKEREQIEASTKSKEEMMKLKAETNLQKYREDIQNLEKEISQLRLKTDSPKIAALRRGIDGSFAGRITDFKTSLAQKESHIPFISEVVSGFAGRGGVKRELECVMCLSEEMSVVFLPCAHQVVCTTCNELHEKQGMKDCPSCRSPIQRRIPVRYALS